MNDRTKKFVDKCRRIHGDKYIYNKVSYVNGDVKIIIICSSHGEFEQRPSSHLRGHGCRKCFSERTSKRLTRTNEYWLEKFINMHGDKYVYDFNVGNFKQVGVYCNEHEKSYILLKGNVAQGHGCMCCRSDLFRNRYKTSVELFIKKANKIHNGKYNYSRVSYVNTHTKIEIICPKHGQFEQTPLNHLQHAGCPSCKKSKGEEKIRLILDDLGIFYKRQVSLGCVNPITGYKLRYDFYIPEYNIIIEYNGKQHYEPVDFGSKIRNANECFDFQKYSDYLKFENCIQKGYKLINIPYTQNITKNYIRNIFL